MKQCESCKYNCGSYCSNPHSVIERGLCSGYKEMDEVRGNYSKGKTFNQKHPRVDRHFTERYEIPRF